MGKWENHGKSLETPWTRHGDLVRWKNEIELLQWDSPACDWWAEGFINSQVVYWVKPYDVLNLGSICNILAFLGFELVKLLALGWGSGRECCLEFGSCFFHPSNRRSHWVSLLKLRLCADLNGLSWIYSEENQTFQALLGCASVSKSFRSHPANPYANNRWPGDCILPKIFSQLT